VRAQLGSSARAIQAGDRIYQSPLVSDFTDRDAALAAAVAAHEADTTAVHGIADTSTLYRAGGTDVAVADGGTGASNAAGARSNLGAQAQDADLDAIAALAPTNDDVIQRKAGAWTNRTIAQLLADLAAPGTTFQPLDADLTAIAALSTTPFGRALLALADAAAARATLDVPSNAEAILDAIVDAKGDLIVGAAADTVARLAVGADGQVLTVDSAQSAGVKWAAAGGGALSAPTFPSGTYVAPLGDGNTGGVPTLNREYVLGFLVGAQTIAEIGVLAGVGGSGDSVARIGIRNDNGGKPGTVASEGTVATSTSGNKFVALNYAHPGGILWVSLVSQGTTSPQWENAGGDPHKSLGWPAIASSHRSAADWAAGHGPIMGYQNGVTGALPSSFSNVNTTNISLWKYIFKGA